MSELTEMPDEIKILIGQCEVGYDKFSNDEMSAALYFGEKCWQKLQDFNDPTPLSDLTDEQWQGLGFEWRYGLLCDFWRWGSAESDWLQWCRDRGLALKGQAFKNVKTLGQLRALMFAIGGE